MVGLDTIHWSDKPWIRGDLHLPRTVLAEVEAHALAEYPRECCGYLVGPSEDAGALGRAVREVNEADKYHERDPVTFPRTSRTYFKMNELRLARAFEEGERTGVPIKVIYHSHCDAGSYFSREDAATFAQSGQLMWPTAFLVVSVVGGAVAGHALWIWEPGSGEFERGELSLQDG